jgi:hypothetical protein
VTGPHISLCREHCNCVHVFCTRKPLQNVSAHANCPSKTRSPHTFILSRKSTQTVAKFSEQSLRENNMPPQGHGFQCVPLQGRACPSVHTIILGVKFIAVWRACPSVHTIILGAEFIAVWRACPSVHTIILGVEFIAVCNLGKTIVMAKQ